MNYLSAENLQVSYGDHILFSNISLGIAQGQKMALVGVNGSGKSTLLRILAGVDVPEKGEVARANGISVAYLSQLPELDPTADVLDAVMMSDDPVISLVREYERCLALSEDPAYEKKLTDLVGQMSELNAWNYEFQVKEILGKLGIHRLDEKIGNLSGGQKKRVGIARALLQQPDLVILDEPTNHLDLDAIEWLEEYLSTSNMAIIMVTHDRYFLENVTNEIVELEGGNLYQYQGNYSYYLEKKEERRNRDETEVEKSRNLMRKELEWIRRQPKARTTKSKARIDAFEDIKTKATRDLTEKKVEVDVVQRRQGGKILELENISKSFGQAKVLVPFSYIFRKGEKVGIVGPNGAGKTTFLNILTEQLKPDTGKAAKGATTVMGYYKQQEPSFDDSQKVIDVIREVTDLVTLSDGSKVSASQMLNRFNFPPKKQYDKVAKLSGGEKRRLQLMLVLLKNPNFLILDEPTNDLDLETLRVLEDFLESFNGCVLLVSHDRYFMDRLVDHLFLFEAGTEIQDYNGSYSSYRAQVKAREANPAPEKQDTTDKKAEADSPKKDRASGLSYKEKREMENLEGEIETISQEISSLTESLQKSALNHQELMDTGARIETLQNSLDQKELRWLELSEKE
jgi:ATP-binding cassette subfamily F protein uup